MKPKLFFFSKLWTSEMTCGWKKFLPKSLVIVWIIIFLPLRILNITWFDSNISKKICQISKQVTYLIWYLNQCDNLQNNTCLFIHYHRGVQQRVLFFLGCDCYRMGYYRFCCDNCFANNRELGYHPNCYSRNVYKWQTRGKGGWVKFQVAYNHTGNSRSRETLLTWKGKNQKIRSLRATICFNSYVRFIRCQIVSKSPTFLDLTFFLHFEQSYFTWFYLLVFQNCETSYINY